MVRLSRIAQIAVTVRDIDRATSFYRDELGMTHLFSAPPGLAFFDCAGTRLMLSSVEAGGSPATVLYFDVPDIRAAHEELAARGIAFTEPPHMIAKLPDREVWIATFADAEGNVVALMSEPRL